MNDSYLKRGVDVISKVINSQIFRLSWENGKLHLKKHNGESISLSQGPMTHDQYLIHCLDFMNGLLQEANNPYRLIEERHHIYFIEQSGSRFTLT